jgi:hypothetical protein
MIIVLHLKFLHSQLILGYIIIISSSSSSSSSNADGYGHWYWKTWLVALVTRQEMWPQQDGAYSHCGRQNDPKSM